MLLASTLSAQDRAPYIDPNDDAAHFGKVEEILFWTPEQQVAGYRNMDQLTPVRWVRAGDSVLELPERPADLDRFRDRMKAAPEVMQCYYITGNSDFLMILSASDMADYEAFTRRNFFAEENIMKFRTSVVMDRVKTGFSIPVPFLDETNAT